MKRSIILTAFLIAHSVFGQSEQELTLDKCQSLAKSNYPLTAQKEILAEAAALISKQLDANYLPKLDLGLQATYQSEVISIPEFVPGMKIASLSKDQYRATIDARQMIYDGGMTANQKNINQTTLQVEQQKLEVALYQLRDRVNQLYFSILLFQENEVLITLLKEDINSKLKSIESGIRNGVVLATNGDILKAELIKLDQKEIEINSDKKAFTEMLAKLIGTPLSEQTIFIIPKVNLSQTIKIEYRPELILFEHQEKNIDARIKIANSNRAPKLYGFAQGGYGRPGLNMLDNTFQPYYIGGIRFTYNILNWNAIKYEKQATSIGKDIIQKQREAFQLNTNLSMIKEVAEIEKLNKLIAKDKEAIALRTKIKENASTRLDLGVITSTEYMTELYAESQSKLNIKIHEIQLLQAQANLLTIQGN